MVMRWIRKWRVFYLAVQASPDLTKCPATQFIVVKLFWGGWLILLVTLKSKVGEMTWRRQRVFDRAVLTRLDPVCPATQFLSLAVAKTISPRITLKQYLPFLTDQMSGRWQKPRHSTQNAGSIWAEQLEFSVIEKFSCRQWQIRGRLVQSSQCTAGNVLSAEFQLPSPILPNPPAPKTKSNATQLT